MTIAIFDNTNKKQLLDFSKRKEIIEKIFEGRPNIKVDTFDGLLVNYAEQHNIFTVIRGLRAVSDFDYEFQIALTNRKLNTKVDTVFLMTDQKYSYLSSTIVRELIKFNADVSALVPSIVHEVVKEQYK